MSGVLKMGIPAAYSRNPQHFEVGESEFHVAGVIVSGFQGSETKARGLAESLAKFRKHHAEVGDALLNLSGIGTPTGKPVSEDEPRQPYRREDPVNDWPKMTYHSNGEQVVAYDRDELKDLKARGYRLEPYPVLRVGVEDPRAEKAILVKQLEQSRSEVNALNDQLTNQQRQMDEMQKQMAEILAMAKK